MADLQNQLWIKRGNDGAYEVAPYRFDGSTSFVTMDSCLGLQQELTALAIESKNRELALAKLEAEVIAIRDRIQFLEKALDQAIEHGSFSIPTEGDFVDIPSHVKWYTPGAVMTGDEITRYVVLPELAQYLKEKKEQ